MYNRKMSISSIVKKILNKIKCKCRCFSDCEISYNASLKRNNTNTNLNNNTNNNENTNINNVSVINTPNTEHRPLPRIPENNYVVIE